LKIFGLLSRGGDVPRQAQQPHEHAPSVDVTGVLREGLPQENDRFIRAMHVRERQRARGGRRVDTSESGPYEEEQDEKEAGAARRHVLHRRAPASIVQSGQRAGLKGDLRMSVELDEKVEAIRTIGVLGAGQMGSGIAQVAASSGFEVRMADASLDLAESSRAKIGKTLHRQVERGKMTDEMARSILGRIVSVSSPGDFAHCDLVVEAATEDTVLKIKVFKECDAAIRPGAWLASNTSSISITKLAAATSRPERVIGMHFMNPPPLMKLIEIVRGVQTSNETYGVISRVAHKMGKTVITSKDAPGFLVNRMLVPFLTEACFALQEGLGTPEDIDTGARLGLNHPMGPLELADLIGLDTMLFIVDVLHREFGDDKYRAPTLLRNLVAAGWYGKKTRRGFYVYDEKGNKTGRAI
jgi:3-hydroxybutyryl-CoA dehydrogenase